MSTAQHGGKRANAGRNASNLNPTKVTIIMPSALLEHARKQGISAYIAALIAKDMGVKFPRVTEFSVDTENGFVWMNFNYGDESLYLQACLEQRADKKGFKKEIKAKSPENGMTWGLCLDANTKAFEALGEEECIALLLKEAKKAGVRVC